MRGSRTLRAVGTDTASKSTGNPRRGQRGGVLTACSCEHGVAGTAIQRWTPRSDTHQSRHASASAQAHARCHDAVGLGASYTVFGAPARRMHCRPSTDTSTSTSTLDASRTPWRIPSTMALGTVHTSLPQQKTEQQAAMVRSQQTRESIKSHAWAARFAEHSAGSALGIPQVPAHPADASGTSAALAGSPRSVPGTGCTGCCAGQE